MLSFRKKLKIVEDINTNKLDLTKVETYIEYLEHKTLTNLVLEKIVTSLIDLDVSVSAIYESISEEDWEDIVSEYETPIEKPLYCEVRDKIKILINTYISLEKVIHKININVLFDVFSKIPMSKTTTVQFFFFRLALHKPRPVLHFFFENLKANPVIYIPYFTSFVSRCDIDSSNAIVAYINYVQNLRRNSSLNFILAAQGLMYICCFRKEYIRHCTEIFDYVFENGIYSYMNSIVVEIFCSISGYEHKIFRSIDNIALYYFPFDKSIFNKVHDLYIDKYVEFNNK